MSRFALSLLTLFLASAAFAQNEPAQKKPAKNAARTVEQVAADVKPSVVVILFTGRDGKQQGLGSGFVVSADGLIATNNHVIGEARPIKVQLADGTRHDVTAIHASDRALDLALVRIQAKDLKPLTLGDPKKVKTGQPIVALGHPRGLEYSVVSGVLSGQRDVEGMSMLQLAMPIEQGNSGGPVVDMDGKVIGLVTMKSLVTANLGFAVPSTALKPLMDRPNPIPMERWLTIGQLDKSEWKMIYGTGWRQRAGRIIADGAGSGFGGRTLCLSQRATPKLPYEVAVTVKLDDEKGAAGLIFGGDDGDRHYGFYPSGGKLRFTRFNGADVFSWKIIEEIPTRHYRQGEWNTLRVRLEKNKILCHVNDELVAELADPDFPGTVVGLAKFRETVAEFKKFQVAERIGTSKLSEDVLAGIHKNIRMLSLEQTPTGKDVEPFVKSAQVSMALLRDKARLLEKQAEQLRKVAHAVHHQGTLADLAQAIKGDDQKIDLARAALLVARLDNEDLDVEVYVKEIDRLAREVQTGLAKDANDRTRLEALNKFLFQERGYHGSRIEYYTRSNSYLNEVIDDREGLPITLSVLYMELARRLNLKVVGVPLPGHFVVRFEPAKGPGQVIDVYDGAKMLSDKQVEETAFKFTGKALDKKHLEPMAKKDVIVRMLHNLLNVAQNEEDRDGMLRYLDAILTVDPDAHEDRWVRAVFRFQTGQRDGSLADVEFLLDQSPEGVDLARVRELQRLLKRQ